MERDRTKWNARFGSQPLELTDPETFIMMHVEELAPGAALDIAAGDGRHAIPLAQRGFSVTAIDIADVGLSRLAEMAAVRDLEIATQQMDLDGPSALTQFDGAFDLVVISHFKPGHDTWPGIVAAVRPGGYVIMTSFNTLQNDRTGFHRPFCLSEDELRNVHPQLEVTHYERFHDTRGELERDLDGYVFRRTVP